jgi:glycosyltransferase involved in cell wall biosynthesis
VCLAVACDALTATAPFVEHGTTYYTVPVSTDSRREHALRALETRQLLRRDLTPYQEVVDEVAPDLVHVHGTEGWFGLGISHWSPPSVISIQGVLSSCARLESRGRDRDAWLSASPRLALRGSGIVHASRTMKRLARREQEVVASCDYFIGRTSFDHAFVASMRPGAKYYHCDELLRDAFMKAPPWTPRDSTPYVVACSGGDYARKGLGIALEAVRLLRAHAGLDVVLRMVGAVRAGESLAAFARRARRLGLAHCIQMTGLLNARQTINALVTADAYCLPSHADNSPNTLCEAMALGLPIAASAAGGIPSIAAHEEDALLVQDGDPYALAGALLRLLRDRQLAMRLAASARARALTRHDPVRVTQELLDAYDAILHDVMARRNGHRL